ncbi:MAG TPA: NrfD/PsrC family molybdoenzyme membrane anchor subunit, partial [Solirubrobacteraceae bacterium]
MTPAVGAPASPDWAARPPEARVAGSAAAFADARGAVTYGDDTDYARAEPRPGQVAAAARRARGGPRPGPVDGPFIHGPVWSWAVPAYFWAGGAASGAAFMAVACDTAGHHAEAVIARRVALGVVALAPPLLIGDLGRRARFLNVLRVFKPRSPMNLGSWALTAFGLGAAGAVGADLAGRPRAGRRLGAATAAVGTYLGSYTGVLLASTAVPVWSRSRGALGPLFVTTATGTGAAATRLAFAASGVAPEHPARRA